MARTRRSTSFARISSSTLTAAALALGFGAVGAATLGSTAAWAATPPGDITIEGAGCEPASAGVTVMVDYSNIAAEGEARIVQQGCAAGTPANGQEALTSAGFTLNDGDFITAIDDQPAAGAFPNGYWAYYHADTPEATDWDYVEVGARDAFPAAGSVDAWVFLTDWQVQPAGKPALTPDGELAVPGTATATPSDATSTSAASQTASATSADQPGEATSGSNEQTSASATSATPTSQYDGATSTTWTVVVIVAVALLVVAAAVGLWVRRRSTGANHATRPGDGREDDGGDRHA